MLLKLCIICLVLLIWHCVNCFGNKTIFGEFQDFLQVETYVLYDLDNDISLIDALPKEVKLYPRIMLTSTVSWELKDFVGKSVLSLVLVNAEQNEDVVTLLKTSLNR